jgi:hypothetical protein
MAGLETMMTEVIYQDMNRVISLSWEEDLSPLGSGAAGASNVV